VASENGAASVLAFRPSPELRARVEAAQIALGDEIGSATPASLQTTIGRLLTEALNARGITVPRPAPDDDDAAG
jgi:hypothetical protein